MKLNSRYGRMNYGKSLSIIFAAALAVYSNSPSEVFAGSEDLFTISTLSVADRVLDLHAEDLNGDGLKDILIVHRKGLEPDETRWISVFWQNREKGFSTAADQSWEADTAAVILDTGNVADDGKMEICYLTPGQIRYYPINGGKYITESRNLFDTKGLTVFPSKRTLPLINFIKDWNGDGSDEIGIFRFEGLSIYAVDSSGVFGSENKISIELDTGMRGGYSGDEGKETSELLASFTFPETVLMDFDNDGLKDLFVTTKDRVIVYRQEPGGRFSAKPTHDVMFDVLTQKEKIDRDTHRETVIEDLNGDGYADAIVTKQTAKGLSNFRGVINIYYGKGGGFSKEPDQMIISEGTASVTTIIRDVNGDGRLDMILPSIRISLTSIIRWLITRSIPINFNIFLLNDDNKYSERPDFSKEVKFKIDFSGESDDQALSLNGDFNGDKRKDFVFGTKEDELSIYLGVSGDKDRLFSNKPVAKVEVAAFGELESIDLDADGYSDMIISYRQNKERKGTVKVLMNMRKLQ